MHVSKLLEEYLVGLQKSSTRDSRNKFYPSSVGRCCREIYYNMCGYPQAPPDARVLLVFENGHGFHERMEKLFERMGILIAPELPIKDPSLNVSGRTDAIIKNVYPGKERLAQDKIVLKGLKGEVVFEGPNSEVIIVELKSINSRGFTRVVSKGAKEDHIWQLQLYMYMTGIRQGILLYENKDTQELHEVWVPYDKAIADRIVNKIKYVNKCVAEGTIPPREHSRSSSACMYCGQAALCWDDGGTSYIPLDEII